MEHKFANKQIAFDFLSILVSRDHSKWRVNVLFKSNNERIKLAHYGIIDRIAEQTL